MYDPARRNPWRLLLAFAAVGALLLVAYFQLTGGRKPDEPKDPAESPPDSGLLDECPPEIDRDIIAAYACHQARDWRSAEAAWTKIQDQAGICPRQAEEVRLNLDLVNRQLVATQVDHWERHPDDDAGAPQEPIPAPSLLSYYPAGKRVKSSAAVDLTGSGTNIRWFFQGQGHFAYSSQLLMDVTVRENNGTTAVFEWHVIDSSQSRATTRLDSLRLVPPQNSILVEWGRGVDRALQGYPHYRTVRRVADIVNLADPGLERTLTTFADRLQLDGRILGKAEEVELVTRIGELSGQKLQVEYDASQGITKITVLEGRTLPDDTLAAIAHNGSLLMDYYLFPATDKRPGDSWTVDVAEVAGLINDGFAVSASGELTIKRDADDGGLAVLRATAGEIVLEATVGAERKEATIKPTRSEIRFSIPDKLVREATFDWHANSAVFSTDHLLFGTATLRDLQLKTFYRAELQNDGSPVGGAASTTSPAPSESTNGK